MTSGPGKKKPTAMNWRVNGHSAEVARKAGVYPAAALAALEEAAARVRELIAGKAGQEAA